MFQFNWGCLKELYNILVQSSFLTQMQFLHQSYSIVRDIWAYSSNYQVLWAFELLSRNIKLSRFNATKNDLQIINQINQNQKDSLLVSSKSYKHLIWYLKTTLKYGSYFYALMASYYRNAIKLYCTRCSVSSIL